MLKQNKTYPKLATLLVGVMGVLSWSLITLLFNDKVMSLPPDELALWNLMPAAIVFITILWIVHIFKGEKNE